MNYKHFYLWVSLWSIIWLFLRILLSSLWSKPVLGLTNPCIFFSATYLFRGMAYLCNCPKVINQSPCAKHMHDTILLFQLPHMYWVCPPCNNDIWPICSYPLCHSTIMIQHLCMILAMGSWLIGFLTSMLKVIISSTISSVIFHHQIWHVKIWQLLKWWTFSWPWSLCCFHSQLQLFHLSVLFILYWPFPLSRARKNLLHLCCSPQCGYHLLLSNSLHICSTE